MNKIEEKIHELKEKSDECIMNSLDLQDQIEVLKQIKAKHFKKAEELLENMDTDPRDEILEFLDKKTKKGIGYE